MRGGSLLLILFCIGTEGFVHKKPSIVSSRRPSTMAQRAQTEGEEWENEQSPLQSKAAVAVSDFKMITENEATLRKIAGVGIGVVTIGSFLGGTHSYTSLSGGLFGAISTYRTGAEYQ